MTMKNPNYKAGCITGKVAILHKTDDPDCCLTILVEDRFQRWRIFGEPCKVETFEDQIVVTTRHDKLINPSHSFCNFAESFDSVEKLHKTLGN